METKRRAGLTETQFQHIIEYLEEERSKHMQKLYVSVGGSILLAIPGFVTLSSLQYAKKVGMTGHAGNRFSDAAFLAWLVCVGATIVLFLTGYQKKFGKMALINRFKREEFTCEYITVGGISGSEGRPPYLMRDTNGVDYYVPVYLEFKQMKPGASAIGIYMATGSERFAVHDTAMDTY